MTDLNIHLSDKEARALICAIDCYRGDPPSIDSPAYLRPVECDDLMRNIARTYLDPNVQGTEDAREIAYRWGRQ